MEGSTSDRRLKSITHLINKFATPTIYDLYHLILEVFYILPLVTSEFIGNRKEHDYNDQYAS
jgi:hypothetical protein